MKRVSFKFHSGYNWHGNGAVYCIGYAFYCGRLIQNNELSTLFDPMASLDCYIDVILRLNGSFSIVIERANGEIFLAVDKNRTFPLFYASSPAGWFVSDNWNFLKKKTNGTPNPKAQKEYICMGYTLADSTLCQEVRAVESGCWVLLNDKPSSYCYKKYSPADLGLSRSEIVANADALFGRVAERMIQLLGNSTAVIPLSGGYDSRAILAMLIKKKFPRILCYSFGNKDSQEAQISKRVADEAGVKHLFIETTPELIARCKEENSFREYIDYAANGTSFPILQDYFAVREMKRLELIPENSIFLPGHSGDTIGGSSFYYKDCESESSLYVLARIIDKKVNLQQLSIADLRYFYCRLNGLLPDTGYSFLDYDIFSIRESHAKFFVNALKVYSFFGYRHHLPLWDDELADFFLQLPFRDRIYKQVYNNVLEKRLFEPLNIKMNIEQSHIPNRRLINTRFLPIKILIKMFLHKMGYAQELYGEDPVCNKLIASALKDDLEEVNLDRCLLPNSLYPIYYLKRQNLLP